MTDKTTNALTQLYAQASAAQAPEAPPAISTAILQAAVQAAADRARLTAATSTAPLPALVTVSISIPVRPSALRRYLRHLPVRMQQLKSALLSIFALPTLRYGLPAMMVAAVGFKIALPEPPHPIDTAATSAAPSVALAAAPVAPVALEKPAPDAKSTVARRPQATATAPTIASNSPPSAAKSEAVLSDTLLPDSLGKDAASAGKNNSLIASPAAAADPLPTPLPTPTPAPVTASMPAPAPQPAMPAVAAAPTASALKRTARASGELSSDIPKELRLRGLIATSRMVNGVVEESCNPQPPDLERVRAWLASGANPAYVPPVPSAVSTLALASRCGFEAAVQLMQGSNKP